MSERYDILCNAGCGKVVGYASKPQKGYICQKCYEISEIKRILIIGGNVNSEKLSKKEIEKIKNDFKPKNYSKIENILIKILNREPTPDEIMNAKNDPFIQVKLLKS